MLFDKGKLEIFYLSSRKLSMSLNHCYSVLCALLIKWGRKSQAFANASWPPTQKNPLWACFKETVVLGTDDSSFPSPVKKPDDEYILGAQGYGLNIKQWIAIMWKVDLESRQWRTHAGAVFVPPCRGQLARCAGGNILCASHVGIVLLDASCDCVGWPLSPSRVSVSQGLESNINSCTCASYAQACRPVMLMKSQELLTGKPDTFRAKDDKPILCTTVSW